MQMARTPQRCSNPSLSSSKSYWGNKRGGIKEGHKIPQNLDPQRYTHKEMNRLGQNVDLDLLSLPLKYGQESSEGKRLVKLKNLEQVWTKISLIEEGEAS